MQHVRGRARDALTAEVAGGPCGREVREVRGEDAARAVLDCRSWSRKLEGARARSSQRIIAMSLSTLFEGYRWSLLAAAGGALTLAGLAIALRSRPAA